MRACVARGSTSETSIEPAFTDPADTNVFWAHGLVAAVDPEAGQQSVEIEPTMFRPYFEKLHGAQQR